MFWLFLLAHFLADYPLQTSWMVANKGRLPALALHAGTHFIVLLVVLSPEWAAVWPYCLVLALVHMLIDRGKIALSTIRPQWVTLPYLIDQLLHYLTMAAVVWWIGQTQPDLDPFLSAAVAIFITGYLLVTYVWAISEKVLTPAQSEYRRELESGFWPRMAARALLLTGLLWWVYPGRPVSAWLAQGVTLPYLSGSYARRALLTDLLAGVSVWLFILAAHWLSLRTF